MKKQFTKYAVIAFLGLTGIMSCSNDDDSTPNNDTNNKSVFHEKDEFMFAYEFENNINISKSKITQEFVLASDGNSPSYITGINSDSKGININGTKLSGNTVFNKDLDEITISFWYKTSNSNRTHLVKLKSVSDQEIRIVKDTDKHFIDGRVSQAGGENKTFNTSNHTRFNNGDWHHVLITISRRNPDYPNQLKYIFYLDGVENGTTGNFSGDGATLFFKGESIEITINPDKADVQMDNLRVYSKSFVGDEINDFLNEGIPAGDE